MCGFGAIASATVKPSMPGIFTSSSTTSYGSPAVHAVSTLAMAAAPLSTVTGRIPQPCDISSSTRRLVSLSSTIRTRRPASGTAGSSAATTGAVAPGAATAKRAVKWNVLPWPGVLSTHTRPPIFSTRCRVMVRPRPVPPWRRVVDMSACSNGANRRSTSSTAMPTPVSRTAKCAPHSSADSRDTVTSTVTSPRSVNLMPLPIRFRSTWRRRSASPTTHSGAPGAMR